MKKSELVFKILGLTTSVVFGVASLVMEVKKKTKLTDEDKDDIANRVVAKIKTTKKTKNTEGVLA